MSLLDHVTLHVSNYEKSKAFYDAALAALGAKAIRAYGKACGYGRAKKPDFWIGEGTASYQKPEDIAHITPVHIAFTTHNRSEVDAFYAAAMAAGGRDFGAPGARPQYHPDYYGAFVLDPDGHNVEAVCHLTE